VQTARSNVLLVLDGLEAKVWGTRENGVVDSDASELGDAHGSSEEDSASEDEDPDEDEDEDEDDSDDPGYQDLEATVGDGVSLPPPSATPSPTSSPAKAAPSLMSHHLLVEHIPQTPLPSSASSTVVRSPLQPLPALVQPASSNPLDLTSPGPSKRPPAVPSYPTYAETETALGVAERALARVLMNVASADGNTLAAELCMCLHSHPSRSITEHSIAPADIHVFLRAPRRFRHPAWSARQRDAKALNAALDPFLVRAGLRDPLPPTGKRTRIAPVDGVYVDFGGPPVAPEVNLPDEDEDDGGQVADEDGGLTWWAWEGTLSGFAEW
jgi:hypothetical protein